MCLVPCFQVYQQHELATGVNATWELPLGRSKQVPKKNATICYVGTQEFTEFSRLFALLWDAMGNQWIRVDSKSWSRSKTLSYLSYRVGVRANVSYPWDPWLSLWVLGDCKQFLQALRPCRSKGSPQVAAQIQPLFLVGFSWSREP